MLCESNTTWRTPGIDAGRKWTAALRLVASKSLTIKNRRGGRLWATQKRGLQQKMDTFAGESAQPLTCTSASKRVKQQTQHNTTHKSIHTDVVLNDHRRVRLGVAFVAVTVHHSHD